MPLPSWPCRALSEDKPSIMFKRLLDNLKQFLSDVKAEVKKVSFPSREETIGSTLVVIVFCLVMSIYLSVVDSFLVWLVSKVI